eukprot:scaffold60929_cov33-Phaeocystis_antarctica.AAC.2
MSRSSTPDCCAARPSAMSGCESSSEVNGRCSTSLTTQRPTKSTICSRQPPTLVPSVGGGSVGMRKMARIGCLHGWQTGGGTGVFGRRLGEAAGALCRAQAASALLRSPRREGEGSSAAARTARLTTLGCISEWGGAPSASSIAVMPSDQTSAL